jgi:hypothetical protein
MAPIQLIIAGGFLSAGKTTLLLRAALELAGRGMRVGLITNDQSRDLVDTALAHDHAIPVEEIGGGCFCCRFPDLIAAVTRLRETVEPDVILAEPVGSCTDLAATVVRPLQAFHGDSVRVAPLTVLVDPQRNAQGMGDLVAYLHDRQLAEAEIIGLSKCDALEQAESAQHLDILRRRYPTARVMPLAARTGDGVAAWIDWCLAHTSVTQQTLAIDYATYAAAEAALGWLNATAELRADRPFTADGWIAGALSALDAAFSAAGAPVAHIKIHLETSQAAFKASLTRSGAPINWDLLPAETRIEQARARLNLRVAAAPELLEQAVRRLAAESPPWIHVELTGIECFSPPAPQPTHRMPAETETL